MYEQVFYVFEDKVRTIKQNITSPIVLVGMMGAGKSHLGRMLAHELECAFYDSDARIEEKAGCTIAEIFDLYGEEKFRAAEKNEIMDLLGKGFCIISTGGGAVMNEEILSAIKENALSIWLAPDLDLLYERLRDKADRPLLSGGDMKEKITEILSHREKNYAQADITLSMNAENEDQVFERLIKILSEHRNTAKF